MVEEFYCCSDEMVVNITIEVILVVHRKNQSEQPTVVSGSLDGTSAIRSSEISAFLTGKHKSHFKATRKI